MFGVTYLEKVAKLLDLAPKRKSEVIKELESHITFTTEELIEQGIPTDEARSQAETRMGTPEDVALRINAEYNTASWKTAIFAALPFLASFLLMLLPKAGHMQLIGIVIIGLIASILSVRELIKDRRPVWLAPCLALAIICCVDLLCPESPSYNRNLNVVVLISFLSLIALIATFMYRKWFIIACLSVSGIFASIIAVRDSNHAVISCCLVGVLVACIIIMGIMFSRCVFELHKYGNAMQASMFLLAFCIISCTQFATLYGATIDTLIGLIMIILVARASSREGKLGAMKNAILGLSMLPVIYGIQMHNMDYFWIATSIVNGFIIAFPLRWLILYPMWCENGTYDVQPPFAVR